MIRYDFAKKKALEIDDKVNACIEFDIGHKFFDQNDNRVGDQSIVILKENGNAISFMTFLTDYEPNNKFKKIEF